MRPEKAAMRIGGKAEWGALRTGAAALAAVALLTACAPKGEKLYARAEQAMAAGKYRAAVIDLKNLVQDEPGNAKYRAALALALLEEGDVPGAAAEVEKAKAATEDAQLWLLASCRVRAAEGKFEDVLKDCRPDAVPEASRPDMNFAVGMAHLGLKQIGEAQASFRAALAARPNDLAALLGLASAVQEAEGVPAARKVLESAPAEMQSRTRYWITRGGFELRWGDFAAAEKAFAAARANLSKDAGAGDELTAMAGLIQAQVQQNKAKEATATAEELMKKAPQNILAKFMRAQAAMISNDLQTARSLLEEVVAAAPGNFQARTMLGVVNLQQGNLGQAELHLGEVVSKQPENWYARRLLAETRIQQREPEAALRVLQGTDTAAMNPALLSMAGRVSLGTGDKQAGLEMLEQAAASKSKDPQLNMELATGYLMAGEVDRAIQILESMPEDQSAAGYQREYLLMLALVGKGQSEAAIERAQELVRTRGYDPVIRNLVAALYGALGKKAEARAELEAALKADPNAVATYLNLARLDLAENNFDGATANMQKALEKDPKNLQASLGLAAVATARKDPKETQRWLDKAAADHPNSVEARSALAQFYVGTGNFAKAKEMADAAAKLAPDNPAVANLQGLVALSNNDFAGSVANLQRATQLAPKVSAYKLNLARAYTVQRDYDAALKQYDAALELEPENFNILTRAAITAFGDKNDAKGQAYLARMKKLQPDSPVTLALDGDIALRDGKARDALTLYQRAFAKAPSGMLTANQYRAGVAAGVPSPEQPLVDWLAKNPDDVVVRLALGEHRQSVGDLDGALREYETALARSPDNGAILNNIAYIYLLKSDPRALPTAEKAYSKLPAVPAVQDTYGYALVRAGQTDKGLELLRTAASAMPGNAEVQVHLAEGLLKAGQKPEAVRMLKGLQASSGASAEVKAQVARLLAEAGQ